LYCGSLAWGTAWRPFCFAVCSRKRSKFALLIFPESTRPGMLMLLSSMTATSSDGTFGWPTPMATPTMTTIATSATPKKIARFRFDRTPWLTGAAA
jgi:hypothetical protein